VMKYVISSYTPNLKGLIRPLPPTSAVSKMMVVIQPTTRGYSSLPGTREELRNIEAHVATGNLIRLGIPESPASVERVFSHLSHISIVHFACHGIQDVSNPLGSAFVLEDGEMLNVSQIMKQEMPNASLAFLSACQTSMGDDTLPDEAIHLAASLLFAGFRGTVATMWCVHWVMVQILSDHSQVNSRCRWSKDCGKLLCQSPQAERNACSPHVLGDNCSCSSTTPGYRPAARRKMFLQTMGSFCSFWTMKPPFAVMIHQEKAFLAVAHSHGSGFVANRELVVQSSGGPVVCSTLYPL
jgi:hypothetical protein